MNPQTLDSIDDMVSNAVEKLTDALYSWGDHEPGDLVNLTGGLLAIAEGLQAIAAALNTDNLSHSICMGIRKGLFGADAKDNRSILEIRKP